MLEHEPTPSRSEVWAPWLAFLVFAAVAWIMVASIDSAYYDRESDEKYYLDYMTRVGTHGLGAFPALFRDWVGDEAAWICPPPSRVGFVCLSALWAQVFGASFQALTYLSLASFLALIAVQYFFATRHFGRARGAWIMALTACSPLLMGMGLQALTDSTITLWAALSAWLFLEAVKAPSSVRVRLLFVAVFTFAIAVKELSVLLAVPFAAFVFIERYARRTPLPLAHFAWMLILPPLVVGGLYWLAAGDLQLLVRTLRIVLTSPATNTYALKFGAGPWYRPVIDFMLFSPWTTLCAIVSLGAFVLRVRRGEYQRELVYFALIPIALIAVYSLFTKNIRYLAIIELSIAVFAVVLVDDLVRARRAGVRAVACTVLVLLLCASGLRTFDLFYRTYRIYDPMTAVLSGARGIVPSR